VAALGGGATRTGVIIVTSLDDPQIADYRALADPTAILRANLIVIEGRLNVRRVLALPRYRIRSILVTPPAYEALFRAGDPPRGQEGRRDARLLSDRRATGAEESRAAPSGETDDDQRLQGIAIYLVEQAVMNEIAGFNIHRGCVALADRPAPARMHDLPLATAGRLLVLEGVNNPDNVGGIFRSAAAFGVDAVVLGPQCSDPFYRKAIRTSMGATLQIPFAPADGWPGALATLRADGFRVLALTPAADARPLDALPRDLTRIALMVGAEGEGLSAGALAAADERVRIPMAEGADSLNVTVAASIALHHFKAALTSLGR
jgi:tRNA G18 (ribose-2'-O)-methylase SpoU